MSTICEDCANVESLSRKQDWYRWRCVRAPAPVKSQFVVWDQYQHQSPHRLCSDVNGAGECDLYEERKNDGECK